MTEMLKIPLSKEGKQALEALAKRERVKSVSEVARRALTQYCYEHGLDVEFGVGQWGGVRYPTKAEAQSDPTRYVETVRIEQERVVMSLADGSNLSAPLWWYPWLEGATPEQRNNIQVHNGGAYWPDLDDGITAEAMAKGPNTRIQAIIAERLKQGQSPH